jgi:hypothetical protein
MNNYYYFRYRDVGLKIFLLFIAVKDEHIF